MNRLELKEGPNFVPQYLDMVRCHYEYIVVDPTEESDAGIAPVLVPDGFKVVPVTEADSVSELEKNVTLNSQAKSVPIGWITDDYLTDKSATTYSKEVAERWSIKGWNVQPIYAAPQQADKLLELETKYSELIMAVARKFPNETRHETALRYIKNAEAPAVASCRENKAVLDQVLGEQWQPIDTVPVNESVLMLRMGKYGRCGMADGYKQENGAIAWPYVNKEPTHWMPLPSAPKEQS